MAGRTNFVVLHQRGPTAADLEVCGLALDRTADDGETVIRELLTKGAGTYLAVPLTNATRLVASESFDLAPPAEPEES